MVKLIEGERIGKAGRLLIGCSAAVFDAAGERVLLTRRADNGRWCLPGGAMEPGESAIEACQREIMEETGLTVRVRRLVGVYSSPHRLLDYGEGRRFHLVSCHFEAEVVGGRLETSDETTEFGYFSWEEVQTLDLMEHHRERIVDTVAHQGPAFVR